MIARVVHQSHVVLELWIKADSKQVLRQGNGVGLEKIGSRKRAGAAHSFEQSRSKDFQIIGSGVVASLQRVGRGSAGS